MNQFIVYALVGVLLILIIVVMQVNSRKFLQDLAILLYEKKDARTYLKKIDSFEGKIFLNSKKRLFNSIDAYIMLNEKHKVEEIFRTLEHKHLGYGSKIGLYQKEVQYYVQQRKFEQAKEAYDILMDLGTKINDKNMAKLLEEATELVEIYVNRNGTYAKVMVEKYNYEPNLMLKGIYAFRAAKCFYYLDDKNKVEKYLKECRSKCKGSIYAKQADLCLNDFTQLEYQ